MSATHPFVLTSATRFQPASLRAQSRSPSRSPLRKSQFAARELDPLLSNLSPASTLKALQTTATISSDGAGQDALAKSIAEASATEREIGIRAAVAAQKLKEWHQEVSKWPWPVRRDRGWGAGFLPPQKTPGQTSTTEDIPHLGYIPASSVQTYQERIEDIRDGIEALELEDIKDHVFSAHVPQRSVSAPLGSGSSSGNIRNTGYGRMRDFTALITATVIQALPELANLSIYLDAWDVRLSVLRQIPDITRNFKSTRAGLQTAFSVIRSAETGPLVTMEEYQITKSILGNKVADLGAQIDKLLDLLEGQEDSLPKSWIDTVENTEAEYATWVVEAEHVAIRNDLLSKALVDKPRPQTMDGFTRSEPDDVQQSSSIPVQHDNIPISEDSDNTQPITNVLMPEQSGNEGTRLLSPVSEPDQKLASSKKPSLTISLPRSGHSRGLSEVSMADSTFSAMSDISMAEIVDAKSTKVLSSPKISVVENPFRASRDELSWFSGPSLYQNTGSRPAMFQRASTASIEVVSKDSIKRLNLTRSRSHDLLGQTPSFQIRPSTPSQALQQLSGDNSGSETISEQPQLDHRHLFPNESSIDAGTASSTISPSPSLRVAPLQVRPKSTGYESHELPELPRRSSKRLSQNLQLSDEELASIEPVATFEEAPARPLEASTPMRQTIEQSDGTLEGKIKTILNTIPTKVRLVQGMEGDEQQQTTSTPSTRSSTPVPSLTLSPVKADRLNRQASPGDVQLFHLTRSGQPRDTPPVKLFVRAVGEHGERVMVRVGGGWADLAEYLREYSLHHGHRSLTNGDLEVANYPSPNSNQKRSSTSYTTTTVTSTPGKAATTLTSSTLQSTGKQRNFAGTPPGGTDPPPLIVSKVRRSSRERLSEGSSSRDGWTTPPVPPIPATYTTQSPTMVTTTKNGITRTSMIDATNLRSSNGQRSVSSPMDSVSSPQNQSSFNSITTTSSLSRKANYTPLGAAGPRSGTTRAASGDVTSMGRRGSWVDGMLGKARAVSGGTTVVHGPTTTTTTTVISRATPKNKRMSAITTPSPASSSRVESPISSASTSTNSQTATQSKRRMSLGDYSGIRRVFLRKKSDE